ncbi:hypothetical protein B0H14DRAFT_2639399 [Mycena olivaceomarginata]|nr:hypothetical protein B0H14DRAFT_2639399 [Mycena olivaceomarginata]
MDWTACVFGFISQNLIPGCQLGARTSAIGIRRVATRLDKARVIFGLPSAVASARPSFCQAHNPTSRGDRTPGDFGGTAVSSFLSTLNHQVSIDLCYHATSIVLLSTFDISRHPFGSALGQNPGDWKADDTAKLRSCSITLRSSPSRKRALIGWVCGQERENCKKNGNPHDSMTRENFSTDRPNLLSGMHVRVVSASCSKGSVGPSDDKKEQQFKVKTLRCAALPITFIREPIFGNSQFWRASLIIWPRAACICHSARNKSKQAGISRNEPNVPGTRYVHAVNYFEATKISNDCSQGSELPSLSTNVKGVNLQAKEFNLLRVMGKKRKRKTPESSGSPNNLDSDLEIPAKIAKRSNQHLPCPDEEDLHLFPIIKATEDVFQEIADDFDVEVDMSISTANRPVTPTNGKRKAEPSDEDEPCSRQRKPN